MSSSCAIHDGCISSIFHEHWWMTAATDDRYDVVEVRKDGDVVASLNVFSKNLNVFSKKKMGLRLIRMPPYTRTLGPRFFLPPSKPFRRAQNVRNVVTELVGKLPAYDSLRISLDPEDETPFAFALNGFAIGQYFTFRISPELPIEDVWNNCDQKTRNLIRTAKKKLTITHDTDIEHYIRMSLVNYPKSENTHDFLRMAKIFEACSQRGRGEVLTAWNEAGAQVATVVLIWDTKNVYFWQSARDPAISIAGANMLLLWESLELAHQKNLTFDFDSFASAESAKMIASFGQLPVPRPRVTDASLRYQCERAANEALHLLRDKGREVYRSCANRFREVA